MLFITFGSIDQSGGIEMTIVVLNEL